MGTGLGQGLQSDGYNLSDECVRRGGGITAMAARVLGVLVTVMGMFIAVGGWVGAWVSVLGGGCAQLVMLFK